MGKRLDMKRSSIPAWWRYLIVYGRRYGFVSYSKLPSTPVTLYYLKKDSGSRADIENEIFNVNLDSCRHVFDGPISVGKLST